MFWFVLLLAAVIAAVIVLRLRSLTSRRTRDANWNNLRLRQQLINQQLATFREKAKKSAP